MQWEYGRPALLTLTLSRLIFCLFSAFVSRKITGFAARRSKQTVAWLRLRRHGGFTVSSLNRHPTHFPVIGSAQCKDGTSSQSGSKKAGKWEMCARRALAKALASPGKKGACSTCHMYTPNVLELPSSCISHMRESTKHGDMTWYSWCGGTGIGRVS